VLILGNFHCIGIVGNLEIIIASTRRYGCFFCVSVHLFKLCLWFLLYIKDSISSCDFILISSIINIIIGAFKEVSFISRT